MDAIDKELVARRFARHRKTYRMYAVVQTEMADALVAALPRREYTQALEFGCGSGLLTDRLLEELSIGRLWRNDLVPEHTTDFLPGDIERILLPSGLDLAAANAVWQWLEAPDRMAEKLAGILNPEGVVAVSSFAPGNLEEIAALLPVALPYRGIAQFRADFARHFDILECGEEIRVLEFSSPRAVLYHLKLTGVTGVRQERWTRSSLQNFEDAYRQRFSSGNGVRLTYRPLRLVGRKKKALKS